MCGGTHSLPASGPALSPEPSPVPPTKKTKQITSLKMKKWAPALINKSWSSFGVNRAQRSSSYHFYWQKPESWKNVNEDFNPRGNIKPPKHPVKSSLL